MEPGTITVTYTVETSSNQKVAGSSPRAIHISVTDEGCGIPDAKLARVLEPLYTTKEPD
jgi:signal transduction histidine kinase